MAIKCCISKRIEYTGKFAANTKAELDEIDRPLSQLYKKITRNMTSYPTALLYLPHSMGGLGLHQASDGIQHAKFSIIQRHLNAGGTIASNMETLLHNAALHASQHPFPNYGLTIPLPKYLSDTCWKKVSYIMQDWETSNSAALAHYLLVTNSHQSTPPPDLFHRRLPGTGPTPTTFTTLVIYTRSHQTLVSLYGMISADQEDATLRNYIPLLPQASLHFSVPSKSGPRPLELLSRPQSWLK